jgi:transcriptional regulator with XRE-family HTH domain
MARRNLRNHMLKSLLFSKGFYQADVAEKSGFTRAYVNEVINGKKPCRKRNETIAELLKISVDAIPWDNKKAA